MLPVWNKFLIKSNIKKTDLELLSAFGQGAFAQNMAWDQLLWNLNYHWSQLAQS